MSAWDFVLVSSSLRTDFFLSSGQRDAAGREEHVDLLRTSPRLAGDRSKNPAAMALAIIWFLSAGLPCINGSRNIRFLIAWQRVTQSHPFALGWWAT